MNAAFGSGVLGRFEAALAGADVAAVAATLAEDVTLHVAVHDAPFEGLTAARSILSVVLDGVLTDVEVEQRIEDSRAAVVLIKARVTGYPRDAYGALVCRPTAGADRIAELTVHLRPLEALEALARAVGRRVSASRPDQPSDGAAGS